LVEYGGGGVYLPLPQPFVKLVDDYFLH
jgi:hypothetical protein